MTITNKSDLVTLLPKVLDAGRGNLSIKASELLTLLLYIANNTDVLLEEKDVSIKNLSVSEKIETNTQEIKSSLTVNGISFISLVEALDKLQYKTDIVAYTYEELTQVTDIADGAIAIVTQTKKFYTYNAAENSWTFVDDYNAATSSGWSSLRYIFATYAQLESLSIFNYKAGDLVLVVDTLTFYKATINPPTFTWTEYKKIKTETLPYIVATSSDLAAYTGADFENKFAYVIDKKAIYQLKSGQWTKSVNLKANVNNRIAIASPVVWNPTTNELDDIEYKLVAIPINLSTYSTGGNGTKTFSLDASKIYQINYFKVFPSSYSADYQLTLTINATHTDGTIETIPITKLTTGRTSQSEWISLFEVQSIEKCTQIEITLTCSNSMLYRNVEYDFFTFELGLANCEKKIEITAEGVNLRAGLSGYAKIVNNKLIAKTNSEVMAEIGPIIKTASSTLTQRQVIQFLSSIFNVTDDGEKTVVQIPTVKSSTFVGGLTGDYLALANDAVWSNKTCISLTAPAGALVILHGIFFSGTEGLVYSSDTGGFKRMFTDPYIKSTTTLGANIIAQLLSTSSWANNALTFNATAGDTDMCFKYESILYKCIDGINHTWTREPLLKGTPLTIAADVSMIPKLALYPVTSGYTFVVPAGYYIAAIVYAVTTNTTSGLISITDFCTDVSIDKTNVPTGKINSTMSVQAIAGTSDKTYTVTGTFTELNLTIIKQKYQ